MINLLSNWIGAQFPTALVLAPLSLGFLVWVYLRRGIGRKIQVSTTLFLHGLQRRREQRKKFIPPLRFFLEILILIIMVAICSGVYLKGDRSRYLLLVDNSFSMESIYDNGKTRLDVALEDLENFLSRISSSSLVKVYTSSPTLKEITDGYSSIVNTKDLIKEIAASFSSDNLEKNISSLLETELSNDTTLVVFTDHPGEAVDSRAVKFHSVPQRKVENVAVTSIRSVLTSKERIKIISEVTGFTKSNISGRVSLSGYNTANNWIELDGIDLTIPSESTKEIEFEVANVGAAYRVKFTSTAKPERDSIKSDNFGWITPDLFEERIGIVTPLSRSELGVQKIGGTIIDRIPLSELSSMPIKDLKKKYKAIIWHRIVPDKLPGINSVFIYPETNNKLFPFASESSGASITRWKDTHPVLNYLNISLINPQNVRTFNLPSWMEEILSNDKGSIIGVGIKEQRYAVIGIELFPYEGDRARLTSILTLNMLKWITDSSINSGFVSPYFETASAKVIDMPSTYEGILNNKIVSPGLFSIPETNTLLLAVNFFDRSESDSTIYNKIIIDKTKSTLQTFIPSNLLSQNLLFILFGVLIIDTLIRLLSIRNRRSI